MGKGKKDKTPKKKDLRKKEKVFNTLNEVLIKTSGRDTNGETKYFEKGQNDYKQDELSLTCEVRAEKMNENSRIEIARCDTEDYRNDMGGDKCNIISPRNICKLKNLKNNEIFESNMPATMSVESPFEKTDSLIIHKDKSCFHLKGYNKSIQFLEDMENFKKKKQKMDEMVMNMGNKKEDDDVDPNKHVYLNDKTRDKEMSPLNVREKETLSYKLKKQKKIEKYKISSEEKEKYMKKYMLKLETQYKEKKDEDLKKEIEEQKEEIKKFNDKEKTFLNYLKNPRLNLSKNEDLNDYLSISPEEICFTDVTKDETQIRDLLITNKGNTLLHVIIIPPSKKHFFIKDIINVYNKNEENSKNNLNNQIAPGHSLKIKLCYNVFTMKQQRDQIKILSEAGNKTIDIKTFVGMPKIRFQKNFNFGPIRSNEKKKKSFYIKNEGQETNVLILPKKLFSFYEKREKIEKEENILNLLVKKKGNSREIRNIGDCGKTSDDSKIIEIKEKEDTYYTFNNIKSYSYNFLFLYRKLTQNFEDLYFENVLQDCYYLSLKNLEEKVVTFSFKSNQVGIYEKDYLIVTDIECNFGELENKKKCDFVNWNQMNVFPFCIKAIIEPVLLNLLHINRNVIGNLYEQKVAEYLQGERRDNLSYFSYSNSLNSYKFPDVQVNSGYNVIELEVLNNGLIDLKVLCSIYIKTNVDREKNNISLDKEDNGIYYYDEVFDATYAHSLYDKVAEGKFTLKEDVKTKKKKKLCPIYISPKEFTLSYKKRQKIYIIFRPQEKHENYKNYCFVLVLKDLRKGSDINIADLLEIQKNRVEKNDGFPLVCIRENKIIKSRKWNQCFGNDISKYEVTSSSDDETCSSYSEISDEEKLKNRQIKMKKYFNKKNKKKKYICFCMNIHANIIKPKIYVKTNKLTKCFLLNPLHLFKTSFTIKNASDFYVNYYFEKLINLSDLSKGRNGILLSKDICVDERGRDEKADDQVVKKGTPKNDATKNDTDIGEEACKKKRDDPFRIKERYMVCYYNYADVLADMRLRKKWEEKEIIENRISGSGRCCGNKRKEKISDGKGNSSNGIKVENIKTIEKKEKIDKEIDEILSRKNMKREKKTSREVNIPPVDECYYNLNKRMIKYFYEMGNSKMVTMYVLIKNSVNEIFKMEKGETKKIGGNFQMEERAKLDAENSLTKRINNKSMNVVKIEKGEYCLMPHEKKKIVLYFLVNHYGYHEINMNVVFYMGKYKIKKNVKGRILTKCKGVEISRDNFIFRNSYSHYCFCNMVEINNLDKDLKLIKLQHIDEKKYDFISLYMLYLYAFKHKGKKRNITNREDLFNNFKRDVNEFVENEIDKRNVKQEGSLYNCNICKCSFKYDCCISFFESKFLTYNDAENYYYYFDKEKYIVENVKRDSRIDNQLTDYFHFNNNFKGIYKYHTDKDLYIHNNKTEHTKNLLIYPSNLLLLPLGKTFFLFFFFLPHAGNISLPLSINWNEFYKKDIFIEGECKNVSIKIKHDKKLGETNIIDTKKGEKNEDIKVRENYVGICSDTFQIKVKNLNELDISYKIFYSKNNEFEYNYYKKKYMMIWNCSPKLDYYYEDFDSFMKVNNIKKAKGKGFFFQSNEELNNEISTLINKHNIDDTENVENIEKKDILLKGKHLIEDERIHGCVIMNDCCLNEIRGKETNRHECRLLIFHDDYITKNKNFVKLKFSINLNYFHRPEVIKVSCCFYRHTFDFILMNENDLLLSLYRYMKMAIYNEKYYQGGERGCVGDVGTKENGTATNLTDSFVNELMDELDFIRMHKNDNKSCDTINNDFEKMRKKFLLNFDEDVLTKFQNFMQTMVPTFEENEKLCQKTKMNKGESWSKEIEQDIYCTNDNEGRKNILEEINNEVDLNMNNDYSDGSGEKASRLMDQKTMKLIWVHKLIHGLNNKICYDFVDFVKNNRNELVYNDEQGEIIGTQDGTNVRTVEFEREHDNKALNRGKIVQQLNCEQIEYKLKEEKISKLNRIEEKRDKEKERYLPNEGINLFKKYCHELNRENDTLYIIINNKNKFDLMLNIHSESHINDNLNIIFHSCIHNLIMQKEWQGISYFINERKLNKKESGVCPETVNLDNINYEKWSKLKHLSAVYKEKNERYYYNYLNKVIYEKREYCFSLRNNFFVDFFQFENVISSMKCSFIKLHLYADNVNLYKDKITLNLSKTEQIFKISITSHIKSLHLLSPYKEKKNGDKYVFVNSLFINKEILKKYEELSKNEKKEEIKKICKCFEEILKPFEIVISNSSNLRKRVQYSFSKIYFGNEKDELGKKNEGEVGPGEQAIKEKYAQEECKEGKQNDKKSNENFVNQRRVDETTEDSFHSSDTENSICEGCGIRIENEIMYLNKKEKRKMKIFLENVLHKEGRYVYKINCNYSYDYPVSIDSENKNELYCNILNENLKKKLSLQFYLSINVQKPKIALLYNSKISYDERVKFDFNYFNKKAYKRIDKMYKNQVINDILYEDINTVNEYFDKIFLRNKNLKLHFFNQQDISFYSYIYTKKFFQIKNVSIDHEEFDHSNTTIYHIKSKSKVCIKIEVDEIMLRNETKNSSHGNLSLKNKMDKKYIYEDFITFQYLTSKKQQKFCIECHYNVPFLIMKENKYLFQEFNNLKGKNQKIENCKELSDIENNLSDKIKGGNILYNEIEMKNRAYFISFNFSELKIYKFCLFLFNMTKIPATWVVKEEETSSGISYSMKRGDNKMFHFSKTKDILFGKTYDVDNINFVKDENRKNPFLFPDYIIVTFTPTGKSDVTKKYCIQVADGEQVDFYLKGIYIPNNDEQTKNC
ncbi:hypothetical protein, conserved [Plasmodium gonderi]|uniref:Uncharacterized protein n=1 Tax=Plasmodium gonderi TaxID=77519 RepID=A0A1Y1JN98_PLAGO|nr:hypothetical protein, conserved [Plasmodium gonderi]GAW82707.1 hypothetical protein, conserved [Plasmodium gonderi]